MQILTPFTGCFGEVARAEVVSPLANWQDNWVQKMNVNFFEWLRDGVRQSVLLGFSDAIEQIGSPPDTKELNEKMASFIDNSDKPKGRRTGSNGSGRKRLGKSLKELDAPK